MSGRIIDSHITSLKLFKDDLISDRLISWFNILLHDTTPCN